ncbi:MAG: GDP-mannose 4,6-dehydratase, partial [Gammaproteobacteria bacterium]|nr:GDP-mannose 4,6-dehydratase [Gammaproteobacteria bacterium]
MNKKALITGISGQDGAYLSNFLLNKGYDVYGAVRRTSSINTGRLSELNVLDQINLVTMDLAEITNIQRVIEEVEPDEVYNLAAQSFVQTSFDQPIYTSEIDALGVTRI